MSFDARQTFAKYFVDVAHVADHVVAISEATRDDYAGARRGGARPCRRSRWSTSAPTS
jgi:hypothetical protein